MDFHGDSESPIRIDTARIYAAGESERQLGYALSKLDDNDKPITIGSKAHPSQPDGLSPKGIRAQLEKSLDAVKYLSSFGEYYLHQPDEDHDLLDSLKTLNQLIDEGKISSIGMSNYHASEVQRAFDLCDEHGLANKPTVYQGLYNPLNRLVENELIPILKNNGCSFVAYNPLAAGLLTGKHSSSGGASVLDGRFKNNPNYMPRFYTKSNFQGLELIRSACDKANISMVEATYRWILHHSALGSDDGILLGASSVHQLEENLNGMKDETLPPSVVEAFDAAWNIVANDKESKPFPYWRSYSADMPERDDLDPGASYKAAKAK